MSKVAIGPAAAGPASEGLSETTVLIVDDHRCFADLPAAALQTVPGIRCLGTAGPAAEGIQRAAELSPSVVVMDIQMPDHRRLGGHPPAPGSQPEHRRRRGHCAPVPAVDGARRGGRRVGVHPQAMRVPDSLWS